MDWTPTLLQFAGLLPCIADADFTWDGRNQYDMLMATDAYNRDEDERKQLILNIEHASSAVLLQHEDVWYKYVTTDAESPSDAWMYSGHRPDVWSVPNQEPDATKSFSVVEYDAETEELMHSQAVNEAFLFDLTNDVDERLNLLDPSLGHFDAALNEKIVSKCTDLISAFKQNELFSNSIAYLHQRLDGIGDPALIDDGLFVRPFLDKKQYRRMLSGMFDDEEAAGRYYSDAFKALYFDEWVCPATSTRSRKGYAGMEADIVKKHDGVTAHRQFYESRDEALTKIAIHVCGAAVGMVAVMRCQERNKNEEQAYRRVA